MAEYQRTGTPALGRHRAAQLLLEVGNRNHRRIADNVREIITSHYLEK
jgi:hypothetical protein